MTVNHDVVGSSPTGGVSKRFSPLFLYFLVLFTMGDNSMIVNGSVKSYCFSDSL